MSITIKELASAGAVEVFDMEARVRAYDLSDQVISKQLDDVAIFLAAGQAHNTLGWVRQANRRLQWLSSSYEAKCLENESLRRRIAELEGKHPDKN